MSIPVQVGEIAEAERHGATTYVEPRPDHPHWSSAREAFTSCGSCSILEPLQDLAELHLRALDDQRRAAAPSGAHP